MEKKINEVTFDSYTGRIVDLYQDLLNYPQSEYREDELLLLIDLSYKSGFKDGLDFSNWLNL